MNEPVGPLLRNAEEVVSPSGDNDEAGTREQNVFTSIALVVAALGIVGGMLVARINRSPAAGSPDEASILLNGGETLGLPRPLADFHLTERSGRRVSRADLTNQFLVVNFVFTSCSLKCMAVNDRMAEIQREIANAPDVRLVSITIDPQTDTPAMLTKFARRFQAETNRWLFLTGDEDALYRLVETSFFPRSSDLASPVSGGLPHTDRIMLVDPKANVCASFNGMKPDAARTILAEIEKLRQANLTQ